MGLLTVDVTPLGVVVAGDSQPVDMFAQHLAIHVQGMKQRDPIVPAYARDFTGFAGFVGTERVAGSVTSEWLREAFRSHYATNLGDLCGKLAADLTEQWASLETHLSVFVAGYENGEPRFWYISNGDVPDPSTTHVPLAFEPVNDLGTAYEADSSSGETLGDFVARKQPSYRRGVLAAAAIFDRFTALVGETMRDPGHPQIALLDSLERYAAYVKFRFEFTKRMYDPKYGIGIDSYPPVFGTIHVYSVDPGGIPRDHAKHVGQSTVIA